VATLDHADADRTGVCYRVLAEREEAARVREVER
jgi:hypothetical protein